MEEYSSMAEFVNIKLHMTKLLEATLFNLLIKVVTHVGEPNDGIALVREHYYVLQDLHSLLLNIQNGHVQPEPEVNRIVNEMDETHRFIDNCHESMVGTFDQ